MHGFADRVRGFAEIEIEHPMRVGDHGRAASGQIGGCLAHSLMRCETSLSRADEAEKGLPPDNGRGRRFPARPNAANSPLPCRAQRDVIRPNHPSGPTTEAAHQGDIRCTGPSISLENSHQKAARERAYSIPLEQFDPGDPELFRTDTFWPYFDRLRQEDPVHYCKDSMFGPYWSVTKYNDIMDIETNHAVFSSAASLGGITIRDVAPDLRRESFIAMDQPRHSAQRKTVAPMFTPTHLDQLAINIRKRSAECLDNLPKNEMFDWVDQVSIELTTQMLAVLFDFPWEDRRKLTRWSDVATTLPGPGRRGRDRRRAAGRTAGMRDVFQQALERAHQPAAEERPVVDDGAQRGHPRHGPEQFPRQSRSC